MKITGFENISKYIDRARNKTAAKILPGEYYVTKQDELISTVLGSCVSACIRDTVLKIGGMNHFMLPIDRENTEVSSLTNATRYGNWAMEHLINDVLKYGTGKRDNLEIKIFGGGAVMENFTFNNIGDKNVQFVLRYLIQENMKISAQDVGGIYPRKIIYEPYTGNVMVKKLTEHHNRTVEEREKEYYKNLSSKPVGGDVELFD